MGGRLESRDGFELTFAVNYLSHFALTAELMPLLRRSTPSRVINVASLGQAPVNFEDPMAERDYEGFRPTRRASSRRSCSPWSSRTGCGRRGRRA